MLEKRAPLSKAALNPKANKSHLGPAWHLNVPLLDTVCLSRISKALEGWGLTNSAFKNGAKRG